MKYGIFAVMILFIGSAAMAQEPEKKSDPKPKKEFKRPGIAKPAPKKVEPAKGK